MTNFKRVYQEAWPSCTVHIHFHPLGQFWRRAVAKSWPISSWPSVEWDACNDDAKPIWLPVQSMRGQINLYPPEHFALFHYLERKSALDWIFYRPTIAIFLPLFTAQNNGVHPYFPTELTGAPAFINNSATFSLPYMKTRRKTKWINFQFCNIGCLSNVKIFCITIQCSTS